MTGVSGESLVLTFLVFGLKCEFVRFVAGYKKESFNPMSEKYQKEKEEYYENVKFDEAELGSNWDMDDLWEWIEGLLEKREEEIIGILEDEIALDPLTKKELMWNENNILLNRIILKIKK